MLHNHLIKRGVAAGLMVAAAALPSAAQARIPLDEGGPGWSTPAPAITPSVPQSGNGFAWGDAGIGAAGAVVLLGAGAVGTGAARRRRTHRTVIG
jgi:hypothetical protein